MSFTDPQSIIQTMFRFDKLFNIIRVVEPVSKKVVPYYENGERPERSVCYDYWKNGAHCPNCVSARALNENDTFVKVEYNQEKIYFVMASPITVSGKRYAVELLKDITKTGIVQDLKGKSTEEINAAIARLNRQIITDELTQVFNRRYLNERLPVDLYDAAQNHTPFSAIMFDIDAFKSINDRNGHACGDAVLRQCCARVKHLVRKGQDWVARYGGDEFFIALPGADPGTVLEIAENIRREIKSLQPDCTEQRISISAGVYTLPEPAGDLSPELFLARIDKNLYRAKQKGRDTVFSG